MTQSTDHTEQLIILAAYEVFKARYNNSLKNVIDKPAKMTNWPGPEASNYAGRRMGSLKVLGYIETVGNNSFWLAQCVCGKYQRLSGSTIGSLHKDRCDLCFAYSRMTTSIKKQINDAIIKRAIEFHFMNAARADLDPGVFNKLLATAKKG